MEKKLAEMQAFLNVQIIGQDRVYSKLTVSNFGTKVCIIVIYY